MAREASLWQRCKTAIKALKECGHLLHACRLENSAGEGNPDVELCINGANPWIELKSCPRPARASTPIRPRTRDSQSVWHRKRTEAGSEMHWVLMQVGDAHQARLYLIPGSHYDEIIAPEDTLAVLSVIDPKATVAEVLLRAAEGW